MTRLSPFLSIGTAIGLLMSPSGLMAQAVKGGGAPHMSGQRTIASPQMNTVPNAPGARMHPAGTLDQRHAAARVHQESVGELDDRGGGPANDLCANATALTVNAPGGCPGGAVNGDNGAATHDGNDPACDATDTGFQDVWYSFNSGTNTSISIELTMGTIEDIGVELLQGTCIGTSVFCDFSALSYVVNVNASTNYRLRLYSNNQYGAGGTFTICLSALGATPPNDLCQDALVQNLGVPGSVTVNGDNTDALDTEVIGVASVWEAFTIAECADVTINYCGTDPAFANVFTSVVDDCDIATATIIDAVSTENCGDGNFIMTYIALAAGTYWVPVLSEAGSEGPYTIEIVTTACGAAPANDLCDNVVIQNLSVPGSVTVTGDNTGATDTEGLDTPSAWEAFTINTCADITVDYCGTDPAFENAFLSLFIDCPFSDFIPATDFDVTTCPDGNVSIFYTGVPAGTYYYAVLTEPGAMGPYSITFTATECSPYCTAGAVVQDFEKIGNVTFAGINNSSTSLAGYEDFSNVTGTVVAGQSYPINITVDGGFATDQGLVWIDFDQSETFDANELVFSSAPGIGPYSGNVAVPGAATLGATRMRVRLHDTYTGIDYQNTPNDTPCDTSTYGQVEDYTINIIDGGSTPPNDDCSNLIPEDLAVGGSLTFTGDNTNATISGDYAPGSPLEADGLASVWHVFTTTECANVTVSYCGTDPAFLNAWIVLVADCPADELTFANDFNTDDCPDGNVTMHYIGLPAGTWYLPVMNDPNLASLAVGPYTIEVSAEPCATAPANDPCTGAIELEVNLSCEPITGTVLGATQSQAAVTCNSFTGIANDDVWYSFVATSPNATITVDGTDTLDAVIELFAGDCQGLVSLACADATLGGGVEEIEMTNLITGNTYFVRVYDYYNGYPVEPTFGICIVGDVGTGIRGEGRDLFTIAPNPNDGDFTVVYGGDAGPVRLEIFDLTGRIVHAENALVQRGTMLKLALGGRVSAGTYTLRLSGGNARSEQRILVR